MDDTSSLKEQVLEIIMDYNVSNLFTDRQIVDTPVDSYEVVNRRFVTRNGTFATRPARAVTGQFYLATDLTYPAWYNGTNWVSATGSVLGIGL